MSEGLKPCPFCGSENIKITTNDVYRDDPRPDARWEAYIECDNCSAKGPHDWGYKITKDEAKDCEVELWQRRAAPEPAPGDLPAVTGSEWTKFIPRAAAFFRDNGDVKLESEINDLACLLYQVARAGLPAPEPAPGDRERAEALAERIYALRGENFILGAHKGGDCYRETCDCIANDLAAEFANVREEQKERDIITAGKAVIDSLRGYQAENNRPEEEILGLIDAVFGFVTAAIRKGEP